MNRELWEHKRGRYAKDVKAVLVTQGGLMQSSIPSLSGKNTKDVVEIAKTNGSTRQYIRAKKAA
jgi:hypothetical protein